MNVKLKIERDGYIICGNSEYELFDDTTHLIHFNKYEGCDDM